MFAGMPQRQAQAFQYLILETRLVHRQKEDQQECGAYSEQQLRFGRAAPPETAQMHPLLRAAYRWPVHAALVRGCPCLCPQ